MKTSCRNRGAFAPRTSPSWLWRFPNRAQGSSLWCSPFPGTRLSPCPSLSLQPAPGSDYIPLPGEKCPSETTRRRIFRICHLNSALQHRLIGRRVLHPSAEQGPRSPGAFPPRGDRVVPVCLGHHEPSARWSTSGGGSCRLLAVLPGNAHSGRWKARSDGPLPSASCRSARGPRQPEATTPPGRRSSTVGSRGCSLLPARGCSRKVPWGPLSWNVPPNPLRLAGRPRGSRLAGRQRPGPLVRSHGGLPPAPVSGQEPSHRAGLRSCLPPHGVSP